MTHPNIQFHFFPSQVVDHGRKAPLLEAYQVRATSATATQSNIVCIIFGKEIPLIVIIMNVFRFTWTSSGPARSVG